MVENRNGEDLEADRRGDSAKPPHQDRVDDPSAANRNDLASIPDQQVPKFRHGGTLGDASQMRVPSATQKCRLVPCVRVPPLKSGKVVRQCRIAGMGRQCACH